MRLRHLFESVRGGTWASEPGIESCDVVCVRVADFDFDRGRIKDDRLTLRSISPSALSRFALDRNDIILEKSGGGEHQPVGRSVLFDGTFSAICSNFTARLRPGTDVVAEYAIYALCDAYWRSAPAYSKQTTGIQNLDVAAFLAQRAAGWHHVDQRRIADFLDRETARIDQITEIGKRRVVGARSLLESRVREATLDGPRMALRRLASIVSGGTPTPDPAHWGGEHQWATPIDLSAAASLVVRTTARSLTSAGVSAAGLSPVPANSILISTRAPIGTVAVSGVSMTFNQGCHAVVCRSQDDAWFIALKLWASTERLRALGNGTTFSELSGEALRSFELPAPPQRMRLELGAEWRSMLQVLERLEDTSAREVALLHEYRQSLITEAVTGQLDVQRASERQMEERLAAAAEGAVA